MNSSNKNLLYSELSKLLENDDEFIYSIPWIQPVKIDEYKINNDYSFIINKSIKNFIFVLFKSIFELCINLIKFIMSFFAKEHNHFPKTDFIILSHLINKDLVKQKKDFYFGNLQEKLELNNIHTLKLFINHTSAKFKKNIFKNCAVIPKISSSKIELQILKTQISLFFSCIRRLSTLRKKKLKYDLICIFLLKIFSFHTQSALRIGFQVKDIINKTSANYLITTFEGHSFEKVICILCKNIKTFAYQNTPLSPCQFSMLHNNNKSLPKIIFTKNHLYKNYLENKVPNLNKIISAGDLKFEKIIYEKTNKIKNSVLFIPEGIESEVSIMISFIKKHHEKNSNINFNIRFHPIFPKKKIERYQLLFANSKNVSFSINTISKDLETNDYVIYRGSNLIFEATRSGLTPLYLDNGIDVNVLKILNLNYYSINFDNDFNFAFLQSLNSNSNTDEKFASLFYPFNYKSILNEL